MPTIGYDSTTDLFGINLATSDNHVVMNGYLTHTPSSSENLTLVGFHTDGAGGDGTLEIGVYRTDTLARIATANVSNTGSGRFTASITGTLSSGVTYCVAWRVVSATSSYRVYYDTTTPCQLSTLTGSSALADPFSTAGGNLNQRYSIFAITEAAGGGGNANLLGGKLAGLLGGKL